MVERCIHNEVSTLSYHPGLPMWHQTMLLLTLPFPVHVHKAFEFILINHRQSKYAAEQFSTEHSFLGLWGNFKCGLCCLICLPNF